jgi:hypothetical protein
MRFQLAVNSIQQPQVSLPTPTPAISSIITAALAVSKVARESMQSIALNSATTVADVKLSGYQNRSPNQRQTCQVAPLWARHSLAIFGSRVYVQIMAEAMCVTSRGSPSRLWRPPLRPPRGWACRSPRSPRPSCTWPQGPRRSASGTWSRASATRSVCPVTPPISSLFLALPQEICHYWSVSLAHPSAHEAA